MNSLKLKQIMDLGTSYVTVFIVKSAIDLNVFEILNNKGKNIYEIATEIAISKDNLEILLEVLVDLELVILKEDQYLLSKETAKFLMKSSKHYMGDFFELQVNSINIYKNLTKYLKNEYQVTMDINFYPLLVKVLFNLMYETAENVALKFAEMNLKSTPRLLDLGCGSGVWGISFAKQIPEIAVTAVDMENVIKVTKKYVTKHKVLRNFDFISSDVLEFKSTEKYDFIILGNLLHCVGKQQSRKLLKNIYNNLKPNGKVIISEIYHGENYNSIFSKVFSIILLLTTDSGKCFTQAEVIDLLKESGFMKITKLKESYIDFPILLVEK